MTHLHPILTARFHLWTVGHLLLQVVLGTGMPVVSALAMVVRTHGRSTLGAAHHGPGAEMPSVASTRPSSASFWEHKSQESSLGPSSREARLAAWETRVAGVAGSTGRRGLRMPMSGVINLVSILNGFRGIIWVFTIRSIREAGRILSSTWIRTIASCPLWLSNNLHLTNSLPLNELNDERARW